MPDRTSDILVVGCGPSGLVAAALLARAGHRVTAIDSAKEPAPRGPLVLTRPGITVLAELEWVDDLRSLTGCSTSSELVLGCPGSSVVVSDRWEMVTVARSTALELFADRALMLGVTLMHGYSAVAPLWDERRVVGVRARDSRGVEHSLSAKVVVDASGPASFLAGALGKLLPHRGAPRCRVVAWLADGAPEKPALAIAHGHWVQTLPSQGGEVVAVVHCDSDPPGDPEAMIDRCVGFLGEVVPPRATGCAVVAQRVGTSLLAQAGDGWIAVGEAAGCGSPGSPGTTSTGLAVASTAAWEVDIALNQGRTVSTGQLGATVALTRQAISLGSLLDRALARAASTGLLECTVETPGRHRLLASMLQGDWTMPRGRLRRLVYLWWLDLKTRRAMRKSTPGREPLDDDDD